jgi:hypothetical protein
LWLIHPPDRLNKTRNQEELNFLAYEQTPIRLTRHSTRVSIIRWTAFVSLSSPFSTVITRNFRPMIVLLRVGPDDGAGLRWWSSSIE